MENILAWSRRLSAPSLRISMGVVLLWIGALKFADPTLVVGLLHNSLPFLASAGFVYLLWAVEVAAAVLLFLGVGVRYVGLLLVLLFAGTLTIFLVAPQVSYGDAGFPRLTLAGEFLLKDLVLLSVGIALAGMEER